MKINIHSMTQYHNALDWPISKDISVIITLLHSYWFTIMQVGCAFVAALLHYFFLAAFCWMLCEGVMLYLMLVVVFSKLSKKWWFFLILGWGEGYTMIFLSIWIYLFIYLLFIYLFIFIYSYPHTSCRERSSLKIPALWSQGWKWKPSFVSLSFVACIYTWGRRKKQV